MIRFLVLRVAFGAEFISVRLRVGGCVYKTKKACKSVGGENKKRLRFHSLLEYFKRF